MLGGQKPRLLVEVANDMGLTTRLRYAPSTRFYLEDQAAGTPWITRLPFPVHLVAETETVDGVSGARLVCRYRYHHGYYDVDEREFRGFGMVEQWDGEAFGVGGHPDLTVPPVRTKTWYHTGAYLEERVVSKQFAAEYFAGDAGALPLADSRLPAGLRGREPGEARRALRGRVLRQEIYADDSLPVSDRPYRVTESNYRVRMLQPGVGRDFAVFAVDPLETVTSDYERDPNDPRVGHAVTLSIDEWGNVLRSLAIAYPRRMAPPGRPEQGQLLVTLTENTWFNHAEDPAWYRLGVPIETRAWELAGVPLPTSTRAVPYSFDAITAVVAEADGAAEAPFETDAPAVDVRKRLIAATRHYYYTDTLDGTRPALGHVEPHALPYATYQLALTPGLITAVFGARVTDTHLHEAGYVRLEAGGPWWIPSGRQVFDAARFYLPSVVVDPFGEVTTIAYDAHALLVETTTDPLGNTIRAENDYRVLQPRRISDPNGNVSSASFDALGLVIATAVEGKGEGDTLSAPTTRLNYHLGNWRDHRLPVAVWVQARETHADPGTRWQEQWVYTDGFGREAMTKAMAEPGPAPSVQGGAVVWSHAAARWVGTGRSVYDNKGNPVKKYEPFFSQTAAYEDEALLVEWGVTPILRYDPLGRLVRTDHPNGTLARVVLAGWSQTSWDENDTVLESGWYASRQGQLGPDGDAASKAAEHAGTPAVAQLDSLGRPFLTVADNGAAGRYETRADLDIQGHERRVTDALGRDALVQSYDLLGRRLHTVSRDTGERWMLPDVVGNDVWRWSSREFAVRHVYDTLRRQTHRFVTPPGATEVLAELTVYGEGHASAAVLNLRGQPYLQCDGAGVVTHEAYDFKGNLLAARRRTAALGQDPPDWSALAMLDDSQAAEAYLAQHADLLADDFTSHTTYDALNRPTVLTAPDGSIVRPAYNETGLLDHVTVSLAHATGSDVYVQDVGYDAKRQREYIVYGNSVRTEYQYDPQTFHLMRLTTRHGADVLQDLAYTYDPVGNITRIADGAQQTLFFANGVVGPKSAYRYDPLYRLVEATGREHIAQNGDQDQVLIPGAAALPTDPQAMRNYTETYAYDAVGNILLVRHQAPNGNWTREYAYTAGTNHLAANSQPGDPPGGPFTATYAHDAHGNMTRMPHLALMRWDHADRLVGADVGGGATAAYAYDAGGERVSKVVARSAGGREERIYLGGFERYRRIDNAGAVTLERETLNILDGERRLVLVETATREDGSGVSLPAPLVRYQLDNHLGSACLELDVAGQLISYEEYHPYGTTSFHATAGTLGPNAKRYRYTGRERDEETGLSNHVARYYAAWLGRWLSADPAGIADGINLYRFVRDNPVILTDPAGRQAGPPDLSPEEWSLVLREAKASHEIFVSRIPTAEDVGGPRLSISDVNGVRRVEVVFVFNVITGYETQSFDGHDRSEAIYRRVELRYTRDFGVRPPESPGVVQVLEETNPYAEKAEQAGKVAEPVVEYGEARSAKFRAMTEALGDIWILRFLGDVLKYAAKYAGTLITGILSVVQGVQTNSVKPVFEGGGEIVGGIVGDAIGTEIGAMLGLAVVVLLIVAGVGLSLLGAGLIIGVAAALGAIAGATVGSEWGKKVGGAVSDFFTETIPEAFEQARNYFSRLLDETTRNLGPFIEGKPGAWLWLGQ